VPAATILPLLDGQSDVAFPRGIRSTQSAEVVRMGSFLFVDGSLKSGILSVFGLTVVGLGSTMSLTPEDLMGVGPQHSALFKS